MDRFKLYQTEKIKPNYLIDIKDNPNTSEPFRTHKVVSLADDFYTNLISWSKNIIAYGIGNKLYALDFHTSKVELLYEYPNKSITSVFHNDDGTKIAVGCNQGKVDVLDLYSLKNKQYKIHRSRIGVIQWNKEVFYTGSRDKTIKMVDERSSSIKICVSSHAQEICGLKLNCTKNYLASGGNDNNIFIYDGRMIIKPMYAIKSHKAAIKALSWSPYNPHNLISGGGTADKNIKIWSIESKPKLLKSIDTNSQVCNLYWSRNNLIISTHGYSQNDSRVLSNNLVCKNVNRGHKNRIIHFSVEDEEDYYLTGSADNVINVWKTPWNNKKNFFR